MTSQGFPRPRFEDRPKRGGSSTRLFGLHERGTARVAIDHRLDAASLDPVLCGLLSSEHVEADTIGLRTQSVVQIGPPDTVADVITVRSGTRHSAIQSLSNLEQYARVQAAVHGVSAAELREGFILTEAAAHWHADLFITGSAALASAAASYTRQVTVVTPLDAMRLLALLLRTRGQCYLHGTPTVRGCGVLPPWWFYRVGAWAAMPEVGDWGRRLKAAHPPDGSGDWGPLALFDRPLEGIIARFARALRARDRVLATVLGLEGNESHDVVLYEAESLALQLSGALDVAAAAIGLQFGLTTDRGNSLSPAALKLHRRDFTDAVRRRRAGITGGDFSRWRDVAKMLGLIRNRIHSAPAVPVARYDAIWFVLPKQDQRRFNALAGKIDGMTAWGAKAATGLDSALIDPWTLTEKAIGVVRDVLSKIASTCLAQLPPVDAVGQPWPWDRETGFSALSLLGLQTRDLNCHNWAEADGADNTHRSC